jgi:streptogramin lyase
MVVGEGGVWTVRYRTLFHVDPSRLEVRTRIELETRGVPFSMNLAVGSGKIWIAYAGGLLGVNPATDEQQRMLTLDEEAAATAADVVVGEGFVWVGLGDGRLIRFDPATGRHRSQTGLDPIDTIAFGHGSVWTADSLDGTVTRYDPETMRAEATIEVAAGPDYLASGEAAVWALSRSLGSLTEIDIAENAAARTVQVGDVPTGLTAGFGAVWVGDKDGVIRRVDEDTRLVTEIPFGAEIRAIAFDEDTNTLWIDVA